MPTATKKAVKKVKKYAVPKSVVEIVKKVQAHILEEPKRLDMADWRRSQAQMPYLGDYFPSCGTTACIAGWTTILSKPIQTDSRGFLVVPGPDQCEREAIQLLQIGKYRRPGSTNQKATADDLFYRSQWPQPFRSRYDRAQRDNNRKRMAKVTADRLEYFITTGR